MANYVPGGVVAEMEWEARRGLDPSALPWKELDEATRNNVISLVNERSRRMLHDLQRRHRVEVGNET